MRFFAASLPFLTSASRIKVDPSTGSFVDTQGSVRVFHGVNAVYKGFPWHPSTGEFDAEYSLNAEDMENLQKWGFNAVRLGVMWHGVEPEEGHFNSTYLNVMRQMVDDLHDHGIYTIVDFHQDVIAERWCGEGIPDWVAAKVQNLKTDCETGLVPWIAYHWLDKACKPFSEYNITRDPSTGFPDRQECLDKPKDFLDYSQTPEVFSTWQAFYKQSDMQEAFQSFWRQVAKTFANSPGVLGYDLINEPNPGDFADPLLFIPGNSDRRNLQPMYKAVSKAILSEDPDAVIMYEPTPIPDTVPLTIPVLGRVYEVGFTEGPADAAHQALSYHIYSCGLADLNCTSEGDTEFLDCPNCDRVASQLVAQRQRDSQKLGGAAFLTEFGSCGSTANCYAEIDRVTTQADAQFHSWAYWQFKYFKDITSISGAVESFYDDDGDLQAEKVAVLSRTYAPKIAGVPGEMRYDRTTKEFYLRYTSNGGSTEIFMNEEMNYDSGYAIHTSDGAVVTDLKNNRFEVQADSGVEVEVSITSGSNPPSLVESAMVIV